MDRIHPNLPHLPVEIPVGIALPELINRVEAARGKPMRVLEVPEMGESGALCGLWLATEDEDLVLHSPSESPLHREQFILHELAHMLLMHDRTSRDLSVLDTDFTDGPASVVNAVAKDDAGELHELARDVAIADYTDTPILQALARDGFEDQQELDAENLADILASRIRGKVNSKFSEVFG